MRERMCAPIDIRVRVRSTAMPPAFAAQSERRAAKPVLNTIVLSYFDPS